MHLQAYIMSRLLDVFPGSGCSPSIWMYSLDLDASGSESGSGCIPKPILCRGFWMYPLDLDASGSESGSGCIHWIRMHLDLDLDASTGSVCIWILIWMHPLDLFAS